MVSGRQHQRCAAVLALVAPGASVVSKKCGLAELGIGFADIELLGDHRRLPGGVNDDLGRVRVRGRIEGKDSDGQPSVIRVGTDRWSGEWSLQAYDTLSQVLPRIVADLKSHDIDAALEEPQTIRIVLDDLKDGSLVSGYTDNGLSMRSSVENSPMR
jgi:hypothetical protein